MEGVRLIVGDCSGGFGSALQAFVGTSLDVVPCLNYHHGEKLDLFFREVCRGETVLVCDDDVFWLGAEPWRWALRQLQEAANRAVVSLAPRARLSQVLGSQVKEAMGSSCLFIRRDLWRQENLSFRWAPSPEPEADWILDTCDQAQIDLEGRGFEVIIAPPQARKELLPLEAVSAWLLKLAKNGPSGIERAADQPLRKAKALRAYWTAMGLNLKLKRLGISQEVFANEALKAAINRLSNQLPEEQSQSIRREIEEQLLRLDLQEEASP
jgi:hypothetical protein